MAFNVLKPHRQLHPTPNKVLEIPCVAREHGYTRRHSLGHKYSLRSIQVIVESLVVAVDIFVVVSVVPVHCTDFTVYDPDHFFNLCHRRGGASEETVVAQFVKLDGANAVFHRPRRSNAYDSIVGPEGGKRRRCCRHLRKERSTRRHTSQGNITSRAASRAQLDLAAGLRKRQETVDSMDNLLKLGCAISFQKMNRCLFWGILKGLRWHFSTL